MEFYKIVKKYLNLRPSNVKHDRVFINYKRVKYTTQPIRINKFEAMLKEVAKFLAESGTIS